MSLRIVEKASLTDIGRQRQGNEDSYLEHEPLFAVADGMGGARAGEVASKIAVEALADRPDTDGSPEQQLAEIARAANRRIHEMAQGDTELAGMGTTLTAALLDGREVVVGHVGDSRLYRLRDGKLERLTHDHSLVEEFVRQGKLTPEEAENHPQRSIITRALGPEPEVDVETFTFPARDGDVYLLCSDGLTGMVSEADVAGVIQSSSSLEESARALVDAANAKGGKDNITVVLFRVEGDAADGEDPDTLAGQETVTGVSPEAIREAVTEADRREGDEGRSEAGTMVVGPEEAERARAERAKRVPAGEETFVLRGEPAAPARGAPVEPGEPGRVEPREPAPPVPAYRRPSRIRRVAGALVALVAVAAVGAGLYWGSRQVWFVGTDDRGQVTLYQGVPYDLPLGIELYSEEYVSSVPAVLLERRQQSRIRDHKWRSRDDAVDLVRDFERRHSRP